MTNTETSAPAIEITHPEQPRGTRRDYFIADNGAAIFTWPNNGQAMRAATISDPVDAGDDPVRVRLIPQTKTGRDHKGHYGIWWPLAELPAEFAAQLRAGMAAADASETTEAEPAEHECNALCNVQNCEQAATEQGPTALSRFHREDQRLAAKAYVVEQAACTQPPATDHEHCPEHGCVEYVCCVPTEQTAESPASAELANVCRWLAAVSEAQAYLVSRGRDGSRAQRVVDALNTERRRLAAGNSQASDNGSYVRSDEKGQVKP